MKRIIPTLLIFLMGRSVVAYENGDTQFWHVEKFKIGLSEDRSFTLEQDFRSGDQAQELYYFHADLGYSLPLGSLGTLALKFREVFELKNDGWLNEHRPYGDITTTFNRGLLKTSLRNRLEYRIRSTETSYRYRHKATVKLNQSFTSLQLSPYLADEIFYDLSESEFNRNRFYLGVELNGFRNPKPSLYYLLQSSFSQGKRTDYHIIGMSFSFGS